MKFVVTGLFFLVGLTVKAGDNEQQYGNLVFSYFKVLSAFTPFLEEYPKNGIEFYIEKDKGWDSDPGHSLTVIEYRNGMEPIINRIYDSEGAFYKSLEKINFQDFDYDAECELAKKRRNTESLEKDGTVSTLINIDGYLYSIDIKFSKLDSHFEGWNIGDEIEFHAEYSENMSKLKQVIDLFALQFGKMRFEL